MINLKNNKGAITLYILVSLVFFIIGLVNVQAHLKSKEARVETEYQKIQSNYEQDANEVYASISSEIERLRISGKVITQNKLTLTDENNDQVVIPKGFKIATDSAILVKDGIVVVAPDGSEFVWVPVEEINNMIMCQSHSGTSDCNIIQSEDGELKCENHTDTLICGKLYRNSLGNVFDSTLSTQQYNLTVGWREPVILTNENGGDASITEGQGIYLLKDIVGIEGTVGTDNEKMLETWRIQLQDEFEKMAKSVYKNKGFYVARFETSLREETDKNGETIKIAQSIKGETSASEVEDSANTWYGFYQKEKEYSSRNSLTGIIESSMIWGSQYDQMMLWMIKNEIDVTSTNPKTAEFPNGTTKNTRTICGSEESDKLNNVYDLLGSKYERTLEAYSSTMRVNRGGYTANSGSYSPSHNSVSGPNGFSEVCSSRITIYLK